MTDNESVIKNSKLLRLMVRYAYADKFNAIIFGGDCCRHEIDQSFLLPESSTSRGSRLNFSFDHEISDLLIITGPITKAQVHGLKKVYNQMPQPTWVMIVGSCAVTGGYLAQSPLVETSVADYLPVDVIVPGCPVRPDDFLAALSSLHRGIKQGELPRGLK